MKILAFAASNSAKSINKQLARHALDIASLHFDDDTAFELLDINDYAMPIYGIDFEEEYGVPDRAQAFLDQIDAADGLIISFAEHNGSYTAAYKSLFDWASRLRPKVYLDKPMLVMSTSPGKGGGANVNKLATASAPHFGATVCSNFSLPSFFNSFDGATGTITDEKLAAALQDCILNLKQSIASG